MCSPITQPERDNHAEIGKVSEGEGKESGEGGGAVTSRLSSEATSPSLCDGIIPSPADCRNGAGKEEKEKEEGRDAQSGQCSRKCVM